MDEIEITMSPTNLLLYFLSEESSILYFARWFHLTLVLVNTLTSECCICFGGSTNILDLFSYHSCAWWFHQTTDYFTWWVQQSYLFFSVLRHFYLIICLVAPPNEG